MSEYRVEKDSLGDVRVPATARYGAQTQCAAENFPVSGIRFPRVFIRALGLIKAAAEINSELSLLAAEKARAIEAAAEVADGRWDGEFVLDVFQTGSSTSTNMNANEVIANRASEVPGGPRSWTTWSRPALIPIFPLRRARILPSVVLT